MRSTIFLLMIPVLILAQISTREAPPPPEIPPELVDVWQQYEQLVREYPDHPLLHYNFGNLAYGTGDYQKALQEYQAALKTGDRQAQARVLYNLGNSLFRAGSIEDSKDFYRKALELNPQDEDARINYELAMLLAQQQQEELQSPAKDPNAEQDNPESSGQDQSGQQGQEEQSRPEESPEQEQSQAQEAGEQQEEAAAADSRRAQPRDDLKREEAEAILNALRANEENLMKRTYRPRVSVKLEKDW